MKHEFRDPLTGRSNWMKAALGPTLPTCAAHQVDSYLRYTGRAGDVVAKAAHDPIRT
jgi:hypothetical protein